MHWKTKLKNLFTQTLACEDMSACKYTKKTIYSNYTDQSNKVMNIKHESEFYFKQKQKAKLPKQIQRLTKLTEKQKYDREGFEMKINNLAVK